MSSRVERLEPFELKGKSESVAGASVVEAWFRELGLVGA